MYNYDQDEIMIQEKEIKKLKKKLKRLRKAAKDIVQDGTADSWVIAKLKEALGKHNG